MTAEYKRDLNRNYLILTDYSDGFQADMLLKNRSDCFISVKREEWDGEKKLYYDITGKQSFERGFCKRKIGFQELAELLYSISILVKECRRLFLDTSGILFSPKYIYRDMGDDKIYWVFYPGEKKTEDIMELAEFLLEHIDNSDYSVVTTAYELYRRAKEGSIEAENLYEILKTDTEKAYSKESADKAVKPFNYFSSLDSAENRNTVKKVKAKDKLGETVDKLFNLMKKKENETKPAASEEYYEKGGNDISQEMPIETESEAAEQPALS